MDGLAKRSRVRFLGVRLAIAVASVLLGMRDARASTYLVYIPLDDPIYQELDTLNNLGYLDTYLPEIKPIARVEAARLTLEAQNNLRDKDDPLAAGMIRELRAELREEVGWLENNRADDLPNLMYQPLERVKAQYIYSAGGQRRFETCVAGVNQYCQGIMAVEGTPLLPYNDGLPTGSGSNEILRLSSWAGVGGFLTAYGEGAVAGPLTHDIEGVSRIQPIAFAAVGSFGNFALSFGMEEMSWGPGYFNQLAQSNNASPFPAFRLQHVHPTVLPGFLRYLGQFNPQIFFGQLDDGRYNWHPYIDGQIFAFKPLPTFEFGLFHMIMFGGRNNNNYSPAGFIGRASGLATGNPTGANTHSQGGIYLKVTFPHWRGLQAYLTTLGDDNMTKEVPGIGRFLPFLAVSYQAGFYLPRLTADGLTDLRLEFGILEPRYAYHAPDSLYYTYETQMMGDALGPDASQVDVQVGRWLNLYRKLSIDGFYTEEAPTYGANVQVPYGLYPYPLGKEHSGGAAVDLMSLPESAPLLTHGLLGTDVRAVVEYVSDLNYRANSHEMRYMISISGFFEPNLRTFQSH